MFVRIFLPTFLTFFLIVFSLRYFFGFQKNKFLSALLIQSIGFSLILSSIVPPVYEMKMEMSEGYTFDSAVPNLVAGLFPLLILGIVFFFVAFKMKKQLKTASDNKMTRKKKILLILIILFIGIVISQDSECKTYDNGWYCDYRIGVTRLIDERKCDSQGGEWNCYGYCRNHYNCDLPFADGGKECTNSDQCIGECIVTRENLIINCPNLDTFKGGECENIRTGECAEYDLTCQVWYEFNDNIIKMEAMYCD